MSASLRAPSAWSLQTAMSIAQSTVARLEQDGIATDESELLTLLRDEGADVQTLLVRLLRAATEAKAFAKAADDRAAELQDRKARYLKQHDAWRQAAFAILEGLPEVFPGGRYKDGEYTASIRAGTQQLVITDEAAIPEPMFVTTRKPDLAAIREAIRAGRHVPGAELSNGMPSLSVRTR